MKKMLFLAVLALSSCVMVIPTSVTQSSSADWHRRADIKRIFILVDEELYFGQNEEENLMLGLRTAFQKRNILSTNHMEKETDLNHRAVTKEKIDKFDPTHLFFINLEGNRVALSIRNTEQNKEVWKGYIKYIGSGKAAADAIIDNLIDKNVL
jgi:hypothetical protein